MLAIPYNHATRKVVHANLKCMSKMRCTLVQELLAVQRARASTLAGEVASLKEQLCTAVSRTAEARPMHGWSRLFLATCVGLHHCYFQHA